MLEQAQITDLTALSAAIASSVQYGALKTDVARIERFLLEYGDGLSLKELVAEASGQDRDKRLARL